MEQQTNHTLATEAERKGYADYQEDRRMRCPFDVTDAEYPEWHKGWAKAYLEHDAKAPA